MIELLRGEADLSYDEVDYGLRFLLELDGEEFLLPDKENWVKFEVRETAEAPERPHGIKYSLTLHNEYGLRLLGYDNSHSFQERKRNRITGRRVEWDHFHRECETREYEFESAEKLLEDFWDGVAELLEKGKI